MHVATHLDRIWWREQAERNKRHEQLLQRLLHLGEFATSPCARLHLAPQPNLHCLLNANVHLIQDTNGRASHAPGDRKHLVLSLLHHFELQDPGYCQREAVAFVQASLEPLLVEWSAHRPVWTTAVQPDLPSLA